MTHIHIGRLLFCLAVTIAGPISLTGMSASSAQSTGKVMPTDKSLDLKTRGLTNRGLITSMFRGDFTKIDLDRSDDLFSALLYQYVKSFDRYCSSSLPENKVELTTKTCAVWNVTRNGYGQEINRYCVNYRNVGTGIYAKRAMRDSLTTLHEQNAADAGRKVSQIFQQTREPSRFMSQMTQLVGDATTIASDMSLIVRINGCSSLALGRFEENLRRFAVNELPISLDGQAAAASINNLQAGQRFKDQDYRKLIEDLILDDARQWGAFARFVHGSVSKATVISRDSKGRPKLVVVPYMWEGIGGMTRGNAKLTFQEGIPRCLTYSETPSVCHSANRKISARYLRGKYSQ